MWSGRIETLYCAIQLKFETLSCLCPRAKSVGQCHDAHAQSDKNRAIEASEPQPLMSGPSDANAFVKAHLDPNLDRVSDSGLGTSISNGQSISESDKCKGKSIEPRISGIIRLTSNIVQAGQLSMSLNIFAEHN